MEVELLPHQLRAIESKKRIIMLCAGRGAGKSIYGGWQITQDMMNGKSGMIIAPTFPSIRTMVYNVINNLSDMNVRFKHHRSEHWITANGQICHYCTGENETNVRGKTDLDFLVSEETQDLSEQIYNVARACLRGKKVRKPRRYIFCTARDKNHWLYPYTNHDDVEYISVDSSKNTFLDAEFARDLSKDFSDVLYRQEVLAEWTDETMGGFVDTEHWNLFTQAGVPGNRAVVSLTIDVAGGGDDTVACVAVGNCIVRIEAAKTAPTLDALTDIAKRALNGLAPTNIGIDSTGIGAFAPAHFGRIFPNANIVGFNFGSSALCDKYTNRRTEMHYNLRHRCEDRTLWLAPSVDPASVTALRSEFLGVRSGLDSKRKLALEKKEDVKKRIGRSPDRLDSVAMIASLNANEYAKLVIRPQTMAFPSRH